MGFILDSGTVGAIHWRGVYSRIRRCEVKKHIESF